jgi:hypothetical protein
LRGRIGGFNAQGFSTTCVCDIDASSSTSALRFLLRRLRQRLSGGRIVVAIWPRDHPLLRDEETELDQSERVPSLRDAVKVCQGSTVTDRPLLLSTA